MSDTFKALMLTCMYLSLSSSSFAQKVDYSVIAVREEAGLDLMKFSSDNDLVAMPLVRRSRTGVAWTANRIIDISPDGAKLGYISARGDVYNIFIKDIDHAGASTQRTNRSAIRDFSFSPDGKYIIFTESAGKTSSIFQTDASKGFVCRQLTSGSMDYSPVFTKDMNSVLFARQEARGISLWQYDLANRYLSNYSYGMTPAVIGKDIVLCTRFTDAGKGEIWKVNFATGVEECLVSDLNISFSTPVPSPDGQWIAFVGGTPLSNETTFYWNTDIYVCRIDGTDLHQLTYHAADDLSPVWSRDGQYIYFISQRGSANALANIWRLSIPRE